MAAAHSEVTAPPNRLLKRVERNLNSRAPGIAIHIGSGYLPGLDLVVAGAALAANRMKELLKCFRT